MMIERLDPRFQFAGLSGLVYNDADISRTFDKKEVPMEGITVFIDGNVNGVFDAGETSTTTDATGRYVFPGLPKGEYTVGTTLTREEYTSTTATPDGTRKGRFDIVINGLEGTSASVRQAFEQARTRWEAIILGDIPDVTTPGGQFFDDLVIDADIKPIDGPLNILGQAAPTDFRDEDQGYLPYKGFMQFDSDDLALLESEGTLDDVILHEMGHVLGLGTIWTTRGLISNINSRQPRFIGVNASREYSNLFREVNLSVPVANTGGGGSREGHFREDVLIEELMTPNINADIDGDGVSDDDLAGSDNSTIFSNGTRKYVNPDTGVTGDYDGDGEADPLLLPLSRITVGQFQDLGYGVNYKAADKWIPATHQVDQVVGTNYGAIADERRISLGSRDRVSTLDLGYVTVTKPTIKNFTISPAPQAAGNNITLSASGITDADGDEFLGVSFYRESNGIEGFQRGGDTFLGLRDFAKNRVYAIEAPTTGLLGDQTYYAFATDEYGRVGKRQGVVNIQSATIPEEIPTGLAVRALSANRARFAFTYNGVDASNFRVELATSRTFDDSTLVRAINLTGEERATTFNGLREGVTYYLRVRAYNLAGAGIYSQVRAFEIA